MRLQDYLNGIGPLVILSAPLMLAALLLSALSSRRPGSTPFRRLSRLLQRAAILLALALPITFLIGAAIFALRVPDVTPFDFHVNYQAAVGLYRHGDSPYSVHAAYSFPFPTFYLYWLASGFGSLSESQTWIVWWLANGAIWAACAWVAWRGLPRVNLTHRSRRECSPAPQAARDFQDRAFSPSLNQDIREGVRRYALVTIPAMTTLWQGQTALLILAGLVGVQFALAQPGKRRLIVGGIGLGWAALIKPQLALVGIGLGLWMIARRDRSAWRVVRLIGAAAVTALIGVALTLILPGGVSLDTYRQFVQETLPQVASPADQLVIGSPAFTAGALALQLGASTRTSDVITSGVTLLVLILAALWTAQRANRPAAEIAAGWGVWTMVAPRVAWMWYGTWCLPFFLLAIQQTRSVWRLALFVIVLALLNLQVDSLAVAFSTMILLSGLLWTSFSPDFEYTRVKPLQPSSQVS